MIKGNSPTHLSEESASIYSLDLAEPCAIAFGNEHEGISEELLSYSDGNILIPQFGMVQSLNISVACAISLYEICRQRILAGKYGEAFNTDLTDHKNVYDQYVQIHTNDKLRKK